MTSLRFRALLLLSFMLLGLCTGCSHEVTFTVVANGKIMNVPVIDEEGQRYLSLDDLKNVLTQLGAEVDLHEGDRVLAIAYSATDETPQDWPASPVDGLTVVFNNHLLKAPFIEEEGRLYLALPAFSSLCKAMHKRVSDPPYTDLMAVAPAEGEAIKAAAAHAAATPALGGHGAKGGH